MRASTLSGLLSPALVLGSGPKPPLNTTLDEAFKTLVNQLWEERHPPSIQDKPEESFDHVNDGN